VKDEYSGFSIGSTNKISYQTNTGYKFLNWTVSTSAADNDVSAVSIADPSSANTTFTVNSAASGNLTFTANALIMPAVESKTPVAGTTTYCDSSVVIVFNHEVEASSLANITISNADDMRNVTSLFNMTYSAADKKVTFTPKTKTTFRPENGTGSYQVNVPASVYYKDGDAEITMAKAETWTYSVSSETSQKVTVNKSSNDSASNSISLGGNGPYSIGSKNSLTDNVDSEYQFLGWTCDNAAVEIENNNSNETYFTVKALPETANPEDPVPPVTIKGYSAKRPSVSQENIYTSGGVECDTPIVLLFDTLCNPDSLVKNDVSLVTVKRSSDYVDVTRLFTAVLSEQNGKHKLTLTPKSTTSLRPSSSDTETYEITVPETVSYLISDEDSPFNGKAVYIKSSVSYSHKVNKQTTSKSNINGTDYNIYDEVSLSYTPVDGYGFFGWNIIFPSTFSRNGNNIVDSTGKVYLSISDTSAENITVTVVDTIIGVTITPKSYLLPEVTSVTLSESGTVVPKDTNIVLTFNKSLDSACASLLNKIKVSINDLNIDSYFDTRTFENNVITLYNTKLLDVTGTDVKTVTVTVPAVFFYKENGTTVRMNEEYSFAYNINSTTNVKAKIDFEIIDGENESKITDGSSGELNISGHQEFDIGQSLTLALNVNSKYQFYGWNVKDSSGNNVSSDILKISDSDSSSTGLVLNEKCEGVKISAVVYKRPSLKSFYPVTENSESVEKDTSIRIEFEHSIEEIGTKNLKIDYTNGSLYKDNYYKTYFNSENESFFDGDESGLNNIIVLENYNLLSLSEDTETITVTLPHEKIYYFTRDNKTKITIGDEDIVSVRRI